jgi:hypothetical protein
MVRTGFAALLAALLSSGCAGSFGARASVSASAEIRLPIADMPTKYASWVVEAEGYLLAVDDAYARFTQARDDLAAALGVEATADAIASFIRDAIQVETRIVCQPPGLRANLAADCRAEANARAAGKAKGGQASGEAAAGIQANCQARASLSLSPGSCEMQTTVSEHPILGDADRWAKIEASMQIILLVSEANDHLDGRGAGINERGLQLHVESVTDLAKDPTLALQLNSIQAELKRGASAVGEANDKQRAMNSDLDTMTGAIDAQFPELRASIRAR